MSGYVPPGLLGAGLGVGLLAVGLLLVVLSGVRVLLVLRQPHRGRVARGILTAGATLAASGVALYAAADGIASVPFRRAVDAAALATVGLALLLAVGMGVRTGRRRPAPPPHSEGPPADPAA